MVGEAGFAPGLSRRFTHEEAGSSLVEVALSLLLILTLMMSIIAMSRLAYAKHFVTFAARQGTRYAMVRGSTFAATSCATAAAYGCQASSTSVTAFVQSQTPLGLSAKNVSVVTTWPGLAGSGLNCLALSGANSPGCVVRVSVSYKFSFGLPFLPSGVTTLQSASAASILQ